MNRFPVVLAAISLATVTSCRSSQTAGSTPEPVSFPKDEAISPAKTTWIVRRVPGSTSYKLKQQASITSHFPTVTTQQLPLQLAEFTLNTENTNHLFEITITKLSPAQSNQETLSLSITANSTDGYISAEFSPKPKTADGICNQAAAAALPGVTVPVFTLPLTMTVGMSWSDSIATSGCAGLIPTRSKTIRTYHVLGESTSGTRAEIAIDTEEKTTTTGEGSEGQHRVTITSSGESKGRLLIDAVDGSLLTATIEVRSLIQVMSSARKQEFEQVVARSITRTK